MSTSIFTNYTSPSMLDSIQPKATTTSSTDASSTTSLGSTFLSLLANELQNQDPTAPMDSTAMVGQMISLNQLDQLISINQTLTGAATPASQQTTAANSAAITSSAQAPNPASVLPFDPNTLLPATSAAASEALNLSALSKTQL